jgi:hypothetical protein
MFGGESHRIADDDALLFQSLDPALHAGTRPADQSCQLRGRGTGILT